MSDPTDLILDFELAPANTTDLEVGSELLEQHTDLEVFGDKGYLSAEVAARLLRANRLRLLTLPRVNQKDQVPPAVRQLMIKLVAQYRERSKQAET